MTPNIEYMFKKNKAVEDFINHIMPFWAANNSIENMRIYLTDEFKKFYDEAFAEGQTNVLNDVNFNKDMKLF